MTSNTSPIKDFYPKVFKYDPNGKGVRWLWVALLPFIDETRLLKAAREAEKKFDEDEVRRNKVRPDILAVHPESVGGRAIIQVVSSGKDLASQSCLMGKDTGGVGGRYLKLGDSTLEVGDYVKSPSKRFASISNNEVVMCDFRLPELGTVSSKLLPGVRIPRPVLSQEDQRIIKPRLGRGMDVSNVIQELRAERIAAGQCRSKFLGIDGSKDI